MLDVSLMDCGTGVKFVAKLWCKWCFYWSLVKTKETISAFPWEFPIYSLFEIFNKIEGAFLDFVQLPLHHFLLTICVNQEEKSMNYRHHPTSQWPINNQFSVHNFERKSNSIYSNTTPIISNSCQTTTFTIWFTVGKNNNYDNWIMEFFSLTWP